MNIKRRPRQLGLDFAWTAMAALVAGTALAASDGALGLNSTGTTIISITKGDQVMITGVTDIALPAWNTGQPAPAGSTSSCVFTATGQYQVITSSLNTSGVDYRLSDGFNFITYTVTWNDGVLGPQAMASGTALFGQTGDPAQPNCGGATPATVSVNIAVSEMNGAPVGVYSDTLTLLITPE